MTPSRSEEGMILVNVLLFVAIASGLVLLMISREELALDQSLRMREAARALAIVRGGELSALTALRRDIAENGPAADYPGEGWGGVAEAGAPIEGGRFDLAIADAESRFNVNAVRDGAAGPTLFFHTLGREAGLADAQIYEAVGYIRRFGPLTDLRPLRLAGLEPEAAARLERLVTALPGKTAINLNAADRELLMILFRDAEVVDRLIAVRERTGQITMRDLADANVTLPWGTTFHSSTFWVRTRATIGGTSQQEAVLIQRRATPEGGIETVPVARWRNAAVPPGAPAFAAPR